MDSPGRLPPEGFTKESCKENLQAYRRRLFELQNVFYADGHFGLLIILQGPDTSGKDGTIRHVMSCMNPAGVRVKSFKKPTAEELQHDFLWRIYPHLPEKGIIQVFNRSYYEDILVPTVTGALPAKQIEHRYTLINVLEEHLMRNSIHILKFYLDLSREEQKKRIAARKVKPHKRWKYDLADEQASTLWPKYEEVQQRIFEKCSGVPWHVVPADKRWFRNYRVAHVLKNYLESLDLSYPKGTH